MSTLGMYSKKERGVITIKSKPLHMLAYVLMFIGGLNWGLVGLLNLNVVDMVLGPGSMLARLVYIVVGLATVWVIITHKSDCKVCSAK